MNTTSVNAALAQIVGAAHVSAQRARFDAPEAPLVCPASVGEVSELLKLAARDSLRVVPLGLGSKLGWCGAAERVDFLLSTRRLVGAVSHEPADGTIAVRAGETIAELSARVERGGHRLTPDIPQPAHCTIGGVVAAGQSGFDRLRFGPVRHHVLGVEAVLGDGTVTRSGGRLVKNVTGFDLHRLYTGSHGTLCVLTEIALRLFPAPEREAWITLSPRDLAHGLELARAARSLPLRAVSITLASLATPAGDAPWSLHARLFGKRAAVEAELAALCASWRGAQVQEDVAARASADALRDASSFAESSQASLTLACEPAQLSKLLSDVLELISDAAWPRHVAVQPLEARIDLGLPLHVAPALLRDFARRARAVATRHGGSAHVRNAPLEALSGLDPFADELPGLELMRELRSQLDPRGVFARGRFAGGL